MKEERRGAALLLFFGLSLATPASAETLAFPGAEGAGRLAAGGRGGAVLRVTNLADSGPGSLRAAVEAHGPRTIIFDVDGTIRLASDLVIREPRITIAGQSAPGGGIALADATLIVRADDVVIRHLRVRRGGRAPGEGDSIWIERGRRIILDHVSASWSIDETLSASSRYPNGDGYYDLTVQWSIIAESLRRSHHSEGEHGYGSLIRGGHGARVSFHHNLWAHHVARMPRPGNYNGPEVDSQGPLMEFRSNLFYNWGRGFAGYDEDEAARISYAFIDNAYISGPDSGGQLAFRERNRLARAWFAGNSMNGVIPADPWSLVTGTIPEGYRLPSPPDIAPVASDPAPSAYERVLAHAGAWPRDSADARVAASVRTRSGRHVDSQQEVGGWPELAAGRPAPDRDGDGMPDAWERAHALDPARPDGNADRDGDGMTNLEDWLAVRAMEVTR
ncbi:pectate lyase family protein [Sphingosinicella sp.]|uniref:pectate lyase family protein n=1 Tax=Sphingosinicella sp. TaxID=1917971 RepID=UPI004037B6E8